jgi:hypothetical protein
MSSDNQSMTLKCLAELGIPPAFAERNTFISGSISMVWRMEETFPAILSRK